MYVHVCAQFLLVRFKEITLPFKAGGVLSNVGVDRRGSPLSFSVVWAKVQENGFGFSH